MGISESATRGTRRVVASVALLMAASGGARYSWAQSAELTSSNLPILLVDSRGVTIPDEPKIMAALRVIDNDGGQRNHVEDPPNGYDGEIGIELRGSSSQALFEKKSYALETRLADGSNNNVSLLGMPVENDWVLHGPYSDKSLIRNALTYELYRRMGRYASAVRFCELVVNGDYRGVYVVLERVKRDNDRVDIAVLEPADSTGDAVTGGYIVKIDKSEGAELGGWRSEYPTMTDPQRRTFYQFHYPRPSEITDDQKDYIQSFISAFESAAASDNFADPYDGYRRYLDVNSVIDYILLSELTNNVDAYRLSTFLYKDRDSADGRLVAGPPWDYNLAIGNANYYGGGDISGFRIRYPVPVHDGFHGPFWWGRLLDDSVFVGSVSSRWLDLRSDVLSTEEVTAMVDSLSTLLDEAHTRNFERWPILDRYIWPNVVVTGDWSSEVSYLKSWLSERLDWMDSNIRTIGGETVDGEDEPVDEGPLLSRPFPNPSSSFFQVSVHLLSSQRIQLSLYDATGRPVRIVADQYLGNHRVHSFRVSTSGFASGLYFIRLSGDGVAASRSVAVVSE